MITDYHAKFFAHDLRSHNVEGVGRLSRALFDAQVDLNPHQIEAALFALKSPLSKGVILADEVGLGKTIEAGIVLCQLWAEKKRRILIICPASIRKQWAIELEEKFNLSSTVLDAKTYNDSLKSGNPRPFDDRENILITSYHFAENHKEEIRSIPWDLATIDEAHKLRNCYRESNRIGQGIRWALEERKKLLLTATPLQNSLLELYGLSTLIDENIFGDRNVFRSLYMNVGGDLEQLRKRVSHFCKRTLRKDVTEYISYTKRRAITHPFKPTDVEHAFYERVSAFLMRPDSYAIPAEQRQLLILRLRKLLASSVHAILGTLRITRSRLIDLRDGKIKECNIAADLMLDDDLDDDLAEQLLAEIEGHKYNDELPSVSIKNLTEEIAELEAIIRSGERLGIESKTTSLTQALSTGFAKMDEFGAARKALVFTESRRTQDALKTFLEENGYRDKVVIFNGSNIGPEVKAIYENWFSKHNGTSRVSGSRSIDSRAAIIDHFRDDATILIATEAAAEGVNMQFCSLLINFDLPWNPQRIEQRIGRCHRYGQKHDVVVINFLNTRNQADQRVHQLLTEKFRLFEDVFGASDEVLGTIESGVDFEKRILEIYQNCRDSDEIQRAFDQLQEELKASIESRLNDTRQLLLENFDEDVHQRLKLELAEAQFNIDAFSRRFWLLTQHILSERATWDDSSLTFNLLKPPTPALVAGPHHLISKSDPRKNLSGSGQLYRLSHPLGEWVIDRGKNLVTHPASITFDISGHITKISLLKDLVGRSGYLRLTHLAIHSYEEEDYLLFSAFTDDGQSIDQETSEKLFSCSASVAPLTQIPEKHSERLIAESRRHIEATISKSLDRNNVHFKQACESIDRWADDIVLAAELKLQQAKAEIRALRTRMRQAETLEEQQQAQEDIRLAEKRKRKARREIDDIEEQTEEKRESLIACLESRLSQKTIPTELFTIHFSVI
jgi:hypothetical protein